MRPLTDYPFIFVNDKKYYVVPCLDDSYTLIHHEHENSKWWNQKRNDLSFDNDVDRSKPIDYTLGL